MSRIAYVNGRYVPHQEAVVHIEDRGYQFADAVYEVCEIWRGRIVDETRHMATTVTRLPSDFAPGEFIGTSDEIDPKTARNV